MARAERCAIEMDKYNTIQRILCPVTIGSPFVVTVGGKPSGRQRAIATRQIQAGEMCVAGQECTVFLALPGNSSSSANLIIRSNESN